MFHCEYTVKNNTENIAFNQNFYYYFRYYTKQFYEKCLLL